MTRIRRVTAAVAVVLLLAPAAAWAHAEISPAVSLSGKLQLYSLAVPTEKSGAATTQVELTLPSGFSIDSFVPAPGWHRVLQQTGSGDNAVIQKVTWTGGRVPTGEDSLFQFLATPASSQTYTFTVRQTYSDGGVVNWSGPESSEAPAPSIEAKSSLGRRRRDLGADNRRADRRGARPARGRARAAQRRPGIWRASARMRRARLTVAALAVVLVALLAPAGASAHAYLVHTVPAASGILDSAPQTVSLTFDEAVEPRFAIVSVTDASGTQHATAAVQRSPANPDTLVVPVNRLQEGWYLVYWRAISVDGHPVQGAFTFAVGPNPGPAPQFPVPRVSATAVTAQLLIARWVMFASIMSAIGLLMLRLLIARAVIRRVPGTTLRVLTRATIVAGGIGLIAIPVYLDFAIANDSLRSVFDLGALVPLFRVTAFGRGYLDLELCFALFCVAGGVALWVDRPDREQRSIAELAAITGALLAAVAVLIIPGAVGHAGQTPPRGLSMFLDAVHLMSGSVWLGGLIGLLVLWLSLRGERPRGAPSRVSVLAVVVPRFSSVAFVSVLVLLATGTGATIIHMPAVNALWDTSYGQAILVKILLLLLALGLAAGNLLRTKPGLAAAREHTERGESATRLLSRLVSGETILVGGAVFVAALLSSLAPPPPSFALQNSALAKVGPGRVARTVQLHGYTLQVLVSPNKAAAPDSFSLRITKGGQPVHGATVTLAFNHLEMEMPQQEYQLREVSPGVYSRSAPALVMVGPWGLTYQITPPGGAPFTARIVDQANG